MKNNNITIIVVIILVMIGGVLYFTNTCNKPLVKGNINSEGEKIYHTPNGEYYDKTIINKSIGERCFFSEKNAILAGWRASSR